MGVRNTLTYEKRRKVEEWGRNHVHMFSNCLLSYIAEKATEDLGFRITESNILRLKSAIGIRRFSLERNLDEKRSHLDKGWADYHFYLSQIERAEQEGKDGFDENKFNKKQRGE